MEFYEEETLFVLSVIMRQISMVQTSWRFDIYQWNLFWTQHFNNSNSGGHSLYKMTACAFQILLIRGAFWLLLCFVIKGVYLNPQFKISIVPHSSAHMANRAGNLVETDRARCCSRFQCAKPLQTIWNRRFHLDVSCCRIILSALGVTIPWFCLQSPLGGPIFGYWNAHVVIFDCEWPPRDSKEVFYCEFKSSGFHLKGL
jgi:hypothetical protein